MVYIVKLLFFWTTYSLAVQVVPLIPKDQASALLYQSSDDETRYLSQNQNTLIALHRGLKQEIKKIDSTQVAFNVYATTNKKKVIIEVDETPMDLWSPAKNKDLFFGNYADKTIAPLGKGSNPKLHLEDNWVSFFDIQTKSLFFEYLPLLGKSRYVLKLTNPNSPYFIPKVEMVDHEHALYTDVNEKGEEALISYNLKTNQFFFLHKTVGAGKKLDVCVFNRQIIIAEFDLSSNHKVTVLSIDYQTNQTFSDKKNLYLDLQSYHPRMVCHSKSYSLAFLKKNTPTPSQKYSFQNSLILISLPKLNIREVSLERPFLQLFSMDERILLQSGGKLYQVIL